jgi:hypothetical protein
MAHVHEEYITIKVSKLLKGDHTGCPCIIGLDDATKESLEAVVADLLNDPSVIIEIDSAHDHGAE